MKLLSPSALVALTLMASACSSQSAEPDAQASSIASDDSATTATAQAPDGPVLKSGVKGLRIAAMSVVPTNERSGSDDAAMCGAIISALKSAGGKAVAAKGWLVTGEETEAGYQVVSFVGSAGQGTSGSCQLNDGNIAMFKDGRLTALAYGAKGTSAIGSITRRDDGGIRIQNGDFLVQPMADLRFGEDGSVSIIPVASSDKVCGGKGSVPNITGMPINKARVVLGKAGWSPSTALGDGEERDERAADLVSRGVPEAQSCSGTGFGYCSFAYTGRGGKLSVTTVGDDEWPTVSDYGVDCKK